MSDNTQPEQTGVIEGSVAKINLGKSTAKAEGQAIGQLIVPAVGETVDYFEAELDADGKLVTKTAKITHVWSTDGMQCVNVELTDGTVRTSVTIGRKPYGWDWPQPTA